MRRQFLWAPSNGLTASINSCCSLSRSGVGLINMLPTLTVLLPTVALPT